MKKTAVYAVTLTVISLAAGAAIGAAVDRQMIKKRLMGLHHDKIAKFEQMKQRGPKEIFEKISSALRLDDKQKEITRQILEKARNDIAAIGKETQEKIMGVRNESNIRMQEILNPEQQKQFQKILSDLEEKGQKTRQFLQKKFGREIPPHQEEGLPPPPPGAPEGTPEELPEPPAPY